MIPYGRQDVSSEEYAAVLAVLQSDWLTQGPSVPAFEEAFRGMACAGEAVAVSNGTAALHLACLAVGLGPGDILWTSPMSFVASANCGMYCGAKVDFVDIDSVTGNMCPDALGEKLQEAERANSLPKVLVVVHYAGQSALMNLIGNLAQRYNIKIIEDASHACGTRTPWGAVGNCHFSDLTTFSFHPVKTITTAEGGMVTTNDHNLAKKLQLLRSHGIEKNAALSDLNGQWYYEQRLLGFNYRMSDLQAALGLVQLKRLQNFVQRRQSLVHRYNKALADTSLTLPLSDPDQDISWHLYRVGLPKGCDRQKLIENLRQRGVGSQVHYIPIHLQPWYKQQGFHKGDFPKAEEWYQHSLSLPLFPAMMEDEQQQVIDAMHELLE